jgi:hypothetical protein
LQLRDTGRDCCCPSALFLAQAGIGLVASTLRKRRPSTTRRFERFNLKRDASRAPIRYGNHTACIYLQDRIRRVRKEIEQLRSQHRFANLPTELQIKIWQHSIRLPYHLGTPPRSHPPATPHICNTCRQGALMNFSSEPCLRYASILSSLLYITQISWITTERCICHSPDSLNHPASSIQGQRSVKALQGQIFTAEITESQLKAPNMAQIRWITLSGNDTGGGGVCDELWCCSCDLRQVGKPHVVIREYLSMKFNCCSVGGPTDKREETLSTCNVQVLCHALT